MREVGAFEDLQPASARRHRGVALMVCLGAFTLGAWCLGHGEGRPFPALAQSEDASVLAQAEGERASDGALLELSAVTEEPSSAGAGGNPLTAAASGRLIFHDRFDDPASGWGTVVSKQGLVEYRDGKLMIRINGIDVPAVSVHDGLFDDLVVDVEASTLDGPTDNALGIALRYQDADNYYAFMISADGYYGILHWEEGVLVFDQPWLYDENGVIAQGMASNRLRVVADGEVLRFYVNGKQLGEVPDARWLEGQVGVFAASLTQPNVLVGFDDWHLWELAQGE